MKKIFLIISLIILLSGCNFTLRINPKCNLGKCKDVKVFTTSFNECRKIQVVTDRGFYIIRGYHSYEIGQEVIVNCRDVYK